MMEESALNVQKPKTPLYHVSIQQYNIKNPPLRVICQHQDPIELKEWQSFKRRRTICPKHSQIPLMKNPIKCVKLRTKNL